ncbi:phosphotransferase [Pseudoclavibacter sp. CFCC 13796]|uniref:phosphotransferase n=1 Tax=Pseudoclavibacter sp. CFCC 13796 TaxID=2615179 RepID=UPI00178856F9|nr:phosphotransferase [Pseudoclavibacter sp. CFCC 13796]
MSRSPLTLAALAASALPGLEVTSVAMHTAGTTGDYDSAVVADGQNRHFIIRVPNSPTAYRHLEEELKSLSALSAGIRTRLPFQVPSEAGRVEFSGTAALIYTYIPGVLIDIADLSRDSPTTASLGRALAALHTLPTGFVDDYGLPHEHPEVVRERSRTIIVRAEKTRLVPRALLDRWLAAIDDDGLWEFEPTVVHGELDDQAVLIEADEVSGVLNWGGLRISDPALDFSWLMHSAVLQAVDAVFDAYGSARGEGALKSLRRRATLYAELQVAKWLLHGVDGEDAKITEDAKHMLQDLADLVDGNYRLLLTDPIFEAERPTADAEPGTPDDFRAERGADSAEHSGDRSDSAEQPKEPIVVTEPIEIVVEEETDEVVVAEVIEDDGEAPDAGDRAEADADETDGDDSHRAAANEENATIVEDDAPESPATRA